MTKELLAEKKRIEKIEKKLQDGANKSKKSRTHLIVLYFYSNFLTP